MKKPLLGKILICIIAAALALSLAGCANSGKTDDSLKKVLDAGRLVLGLDLGFPPMGFVDEKGEIVGFDIDVARAVCGRLGVELVTKGINWNTKEKDLNDGTIDCIWNGMSVTPQRSETMNLSDPYMKNEMIFVVRGDSEISAFRDLKDRTVGVQSGSTAQELLEESDLIANVTEIAFEDNQALLLQLEEGKLDAALVDSVAAYYFIFSKDEQFFILPDSLGEEEYAIGFRKGDQKLRDEIQKILGELKADGTLGEISQKWFGSDITTVR